MTDGQQIVRIRNSLIFQEGGKFDWSPQERPQWFRQETASTPPFFRAVGEQLTLASDSSTAFEAALQIARHLHPYGRAKGGIIATNTESTYRRIMASGEGYCGDYSQVFTAIAHSVGIPVREWGISFENYSGKGHAFNEIYSEKYSKWLFLDSFNGFYVTNAVGVPLSYQELKSALLAPHDQALRVTRIGPEMFAFRSDEMALDYIERGTRQSFLWTANDVFTYDSNWLVQLTSHFSRSLEQASAILIGAHPGIMLDAEGADSGAIRELAQIRLFAFCAAVSAVFLCGFVATSLLVWRRRRKLHAAS